MNEKTLNSLMEDLTVIYETRPEVGLIDYTIHKDRLIRCHFLGFGSLAAAMLTGILSRYAEYLMWCVQPYGCRSPNTVEIDIFGFEIERDREFQPICKNEPAQSKEFPYFGD